MAGNQGGRVLLNATAMWQRTFNDTYSSTTFASLSSETITPVSGMVSSDTAVVTDLPWFASGKSESCCMLTGGVVAHFDEEICLVVLALVCGKVGVSAQSTRTRRRQRLFGAARRGTQTTACPAALGGYLFLPSWVPAERSQRLFRTETLPRTKLDVQPVNTLSLEILMAHSRKLFLASCVAYPKALLHMQDER